MEPSAIQFTINVWSSLPSRALNDCQKRNALATTLTFMFWGDIVDFKINVFTGRITAGILYNKRFVRVRFRIFQIRHDVSHIPITRSGRVGNECNGGVRAGAASKFVIIVIRSCGFYTIGSSNKTYDILRVSC